MSTETNERKFKGVWIPAAIWNHKALTWMEKCVIAEIDSLSDAASPCIASDDYIAEKFDISRGRMANILSKLRRENFLETVSFDGRRRGMRVKAGFTETVKDPLTDSVKASLTDSVTPNKGGSRSVPRVGNEATPPGVHVKFIDRWAEAFKAHFGFDYKFGGGKDGRAVKELVTSSADVDVEQWIDLASRAWVRSGQAPKAFGCERAATIHGFANAINEIRVELANASKPLEFCNSRPTSRPVRGAAPQAAAQAPAVAGGPVTVAEWQAHWETVLERGWVPCPLNFGSAESEGYYAAIEKRSAAMKAGAVK